MFPKLLEVPGIAYRQSVSNDRAVSVCLYSSVRVGQGMKKDSKRAFEGRAKRNSLRRLSRRNYERQSE